MRDGGFRIAGAVLAAVLSGCAGIDFDMDKPESHTRADTRQTALGQRAVELSDGHAGHASGFILQADGVEALATRLLLAARAEMTIDAQYYLIGDDPVAHLFVESLLRAADRGVRVRLLLDDIFTKGYDQGMAALDSHPNFEIRVFNPFRRGARALKSIRDFRRVNRRMHNKSFTVDNSVTVIGGRNIAAEYFAGREDVNFGDLDALAVGPIVRDVSAQFDAYWNDRYAVPVSQFVKPREDPAARLAALRARSEQSQAEVRGTPYAGALTKTIEDLIGEGPGDFVWVPGELIFDTPEKARRATLEGDYDIVNPLRRELEAAEEEVIIASPYLVPSKDTIASAGALTARGVDVIVITNSLASNNHAIVHSGYAPRRRALLENGVTIYEVRPDAHVSGTELSGVEHSEGTLHTKAFVVDGEVLFLGSFNFDPRSRHINTELGVIIESPELAGGISDQVHAVLDEATYRVDVDERNRMRWTTYNEGQKVVYYKEPETSWWLRTKVNLMKLLPIKGQL